MILETLTTRGIRISVETHFQEEYSKPISNKFLFTYRVTIENVGSQPAQLISRRWEIVDSHGQRREVEGEGVVGKQPVLHPGESHQYVSWCPLSSEIGKMSGSYLMENLETGEQYTVFIPMFKLISTAILN